MEAIFITEEELDYLTNVPVMVCEPAIPLRHKMSFEEAVAACNGITLEEFSIMWKESINKLIPK